MTPDLIGGIAVAGAGVVFIILSIFFFRRNSYFKKHCTATTTGKVIKYKFGGKSGAHWVSPLVEFYVDGKKYKAYRHYKGVVSVHAPKIDPGSFIGKGDSFFISKNDMFHINTSGSIHNYRKMGEETWPIGTELPVVYNPEKPKQAFVEKVVTINNIAGICFLCCGAGFILLGVLFGILLK